MRGFTRRRRQVDPLVDREGLSDLAAYLRSPGFASGSSDPAKQGEWLAGEVERNLSVDTDADIFEEYVAAHRMLSHVTPRRVLEAMAEGKDDDLAAQLPTHIRETFDEIRNGLGKKIMALAMASSVVFNREKPLLDVGRKEFALAIMDEPPAVKGLAFAHASGKSPEEIHQIAIRAVSKTLKSEPKDPT